MNDHVWDTTSYAPTSERSHEQPGQSTQHVANEGRALWCYECLIPFPKQILFEQHKQDVHSAISEPSAKEHGSGMSRTPISCQQCSKAKAGCDKKRPCSRCKAKHLNCQPRFARRATKDASKQNYRSSRRRASVTFLLGSSPDPLPESPTPSTEQNEAVELRSSSTDRLMTRSSLQPLLTSPDKSEPSSTASPIHFVPPSILLPSALNQYDDIVSYGPLTEDGWTSNISATAEDVYLPGTVTPQQFLTECLPTPALSPTDPRTLEHRRWNSLYVWDGYQDKPASHKPQQQAGVLHDWPGTLDDSWPIVRCLTGQRLERHQSHFSSWLVSKLEQHLPWHDLDQYIAVDETMMHTPEEPLPAEPILFTIAHLLRRVLAKHRTAGDDAARTGARSWTLASSGLPSEHSLQCLINRGRKALKVHITASAFAELDSHDEPNTPIPLLLAQGLLLTSHPDATLLALCIIECENTSTFHQLNLGVAPQRSHISLLERVTAWSGYGSFMAMAVVYYRLDFSTLPVEVVERSDPLDDGYGLNALAISLLYGQVPTPQPRELPISRPGRSPMTSLDDAFHESMVVHQSSSASTGHLTTSASATLNNHETERELAYLLGNTYRLIYHLREVSRLTMPEDALSAGLGLTGAHSMASSHSTLTGWFLNFRKSSTFVYQNSETLEMLTLYSLMWLTTVVDSRDVERKARREDTLPSGSAASEALQNERDYVLKQVHCGQVFRLLEQLRDSPPLWWPLAAYQATLVLWYTSLTPFKKESSATIDPSLIISSEMGSVLWASTVSINDLDLSDDRTEAILRLEEDAVFVLNANNGSNVSTSHPEHVLGYGISFIEKGRPSLLKDGVLARMRAMEMTWYEAGGIEPESTPCSME